MADSGLETGCLASPRGIISDKSRADLDEPNESSALAIKSEEAKHVNPSRRDHTNTSRESTTGGRDEIAEYENRVLSEPFDQSHSESDNDDEQAKVQAAASSLAFSPQANSFCFGSRDNGPTDRERPSKRDITQNGKELNGLFMPQPVPKRQPNNSSVNNYYFIDASSLNDDIDMTTTNIVGYPNDDNDTRMSWSNAQMSTNCYASSPKFSSIYLNDDPVKLPSRLTSINSQKRYEVAAGGVDFYKPGADCRALRKPEQLVSCDKESLAVEIKESDSGESAVHSPCPDNSSRPEDSARSAAQQPQERAPLIRRNTFELDASDEKLSSLRQEYERQQGSLVFQNSITQYSQHRIDDDEPYFEMALGATSSSASAFAPAACDLVPDKYRLDASEKESKPVAVAQIEQGLGCDLARSASDNKFLTRVSDDYCSLPLGINDQLCPRSPQLNSRLRRHEALPIVSGASSSSDFQKPSDSPAVKRRTESTPILSGGCVLPIAEQPKLIKTASAVSSQAAWVVDMSDCRGSTSSINTTTNNSSSSSSSIARKDKQPSSLGYFVNLEDIAAPAEQPVQATPELQAKHRRRPSCGSASSAKSYCEFFVDLSDDKSDKSSSIEAASSSLAASEPASKKNIFSMFIDLKEVEAGGTRASVAKSSSSSKLAEKRQELANKLDCESEQKKPKSGVFMFIDSDSPIVRRRTMSSSRPAAFKRHSWNTDKSQEQTSQSSIEHLAPSTGSGEQLQQLQQQQQHQHSLVAAKRLHKRAHSLSVDRNTTHDFRKMLAHKSSISSHSLNEVLGNVDVLRTEQQKQQQQHQRKEDTFDYEDRDTPPNSHVEIIDEELLVSLKNRNYQELDAINEQTAAGEAKSQEPARPDADCVSENSVWEKTPTESTETTTQQTRKSETFDVSTDPSSSSENVEFKLPDLLDVTPKLTSNMAKQSLEMNGKHYEQNNDKMTNSTGPQVTNTTPSSFVKLSDLDKKPASSGTNSGTPASTSRETPYRMSISVTETSWIENRLIMMNRSSDFHRPFVKKLPLSASKCAKSENFDDFGNEADPEAVISESDLSSLQSSMGRSGQGSTEETETSTSFALGKPYNRLGEDLLRMFLDEINPDVTVDVGGRRIRAHKCILSSRCQYFAAILSGGWIESAGNVISLQGYSYNAVHFALCHIYSGESCIPDSISIVELATLADMLCLEGLKEVIGFTLKVKYCHLFHKPCKGCSVGVLECMPLAAAYGLDEVYRKSLRWVTRHFVRIWPTKEFATLPRELMDKCYHQHIVHMSTDNVMQTIMDCDKLLTTLPNVRWAEPVFRLASNLLDASMKYLTDNYASVLGNEGFQVLDRELTWNISRMEDHLLAAAERLPPEQACKSYSKLDKIFTLAQLDDSQRASFKTAPLFMDLMEKIRAQVEKCLVRDAARAARTGAWLKMDLELRRRVQEMACLVIMPNEATKRPSRHSNFMKEPKDRPDNRSSLVSKVTSNRTLDLRRVKMAISEHNDRTLKQTPLLQTRKIMNKPKTDPLERKLQSDKLANDTSSSVSRPKSWPNKVEVNKIKSRYLEPRVRPNIKDTALQPTNQDKPTSQQRKKILISSSDSSRTSSPAMKRAAERKTLTKVPLKRDGKTLSSDSINSSTEPRLRARKQAASKSCGMTRAESPLLKAKNIDAGLSIDSLSEPRKKALIKAARSDTPSDSPLTDTTSMTTPKSTTTNKSSPILGKAMANLSISQKQHLDKANKSSPLAQRNATSNTIRRSARSVESSTAASRSRAAATVNTYNGSLNLRKSLLDAAKAPDIPSKTTTPLSMRSSFRQPNQSMRSSSSSSFSVKDKLLDKKDESNQKSISSPATKRSPRANLNSRLTKSNILVNKQKNKTEDKSSNKNKSQTAAAAGTDGPKFLKQISRSGTFLKDEPTILNKSDIQTAAIDV